MSAEQELRVRLRLNGEDVELSAPPRLLLADALRALGSNGTHTGCEHGVCGACTVLVDGQPARSCLIFAVQADGASVETVEALAGPDEPLTPLQESLHRHHGLQCGYCTSGILMSMTALLREDPSPDEETVRDTLQGHICRCTGYQQIVDAVLDVAQEGRS